jgi:hypothetical protein
MAHAHRVKIGTEAEFMDVLFQIRWKSFQRLLPEKFRGSRISHTVQIKRWNTARDNSLSFTLIILLHKFFAVFDNRNQIKLHFWARRTKLLKSLAPTVHTHTRFIYWKAANYANNTLIKKKTKFFVISYMKKFRCDRVQSHIWGRAS